jgi:hypothetical protein
VGGRAVFASSNNFWISSGSSGFNVHCSSGPSSARSSSRLGSSESRWLRNGSGSSVSPCLIASVVGVGRGDFGPGYGDKESFRRLRRRAERSDSGVASLEGSLSSGWGLSRRLVSGEVLCV